MAASPDPGPFQSLAQQFTIIGPRKPDLLTQAAIEITKMIRDGEHYRRRATRRTDLLSAAKHIEGVQKAFRPGRRGDADTSHREGSN